MLHKTLVTQIVIALALLPSVGKAGPAQCFMHGIIVPTAGNMEKASLSDMIRLRFDASEKAKCEQMMTAYCTYNVKEKQYSPARLKGSFKPDIDKSDEFQYTFTEKCSLITE